MRNLDVFSKEPITLTFGDPQNPKMRGMWKTGFGGISTICFMTVLLLYISTSFVALDTGEKDIVEDFTFETTAYSNVSLGFDQMKVMPVVSLTMDTPHIYINTSSSSY